MSLCCCKMVYSIVLELTSNISVCPLHHVPFILMLPKKHTSPVQPHMEVISIHCQCQVCLNMRCTEIQRYRVVRVLN